MTKLPVAVIAGAASGIGHALCRRLAEQGWQVVGSSRDASRLAPLPLTLAVQCDVSQADGARMLMSQAEALGPVTALAICAGNTLIAPLHKTSAAQLHEVWTANVATAWNVLQAWVEARRQIPAAGAAVLCSSVVARIGVANHEAIALAKGAIEGLARSTAATYAASGLRVNVVAPGMTETPMTAAMLRSDSMREAAGKQYPLGGVQAADTVADAMAWLLSPASSRITGQILPVDGGFTAVRPLVR
jgi:NAD(P)-dependent dehydrogenase (short-subunit alcohol dehydrogenase family)